MKCHRSKCEQVKRLERLAAYTRRIHTLHTRESYLVRSGLIEAFSFGPPLEVCGRNAAVFAYGRCATH